MKRLTYSNMIKEVPDIDEYLSVSGAVVEVNKMGNGREYFSADLGYDKNGQTYIRSTDHGVAHDELFLDMLVKYRKGLRVQLRVIDKFMQLHQKEIAANSLAAKEKAPSNAMEEAEKHSELSTIVASAIDRWANVDDRDDWEGWHS
jgi:hypothetical protein